MKDCGQSPVITDMVITQISIRYIIAGGNDRQAYHSCDPIQLHSPIQPSVLSLIYLGLEKTVTKQYRYSNLGDGNQNKYYKGVSVIICDIFSMVSISSEC